MPSVLYIMVRELPKSQLQFLWRLNLGRLCTFGLTGKEKKQLASNQRNPAVWEHGGQGGGRRSGEGGRVGEGRGGMGRGRSQQEAWGRGGVG